MNSYFDNTTKAGTLSGIFLTLLGNINSDDLIKTALLAGVGAVVSFLITHLMKFVIRRIKK